MSSSINTPVFGNRAPVTLYQVPDEHILSILNYGSYLDVSRFCSATKSNYSLLSSEYPALAEKMRRTSDILNRIDPLSARRIAHRHSVFEVGTVEQAAHRVRVDNEELCKAWPILRDTLLDPYRDFKISSLNTPDPNSLPPADAQAADIRKWLSDRKNQHYLHQVKTIHLSNCGLTKIPKELAYFDRLITLDLSGNRISQVPDWLSLFGLMTILILSDNPIRQFPKDLKLPKITRLILNNTKLRAFPSAIRHYETLTHLYLEGNSDIVTFPQNLQLPENLKKIFFSEQNHEQSQEQFELMNRLLSERNRPLTEWLSGPRAG